MSVSAQPAKPIIQQLTPEIVGQLVENQTKDHNFNLRGENKMATVQQEEALHYFKAHAQDRREPLHVSSGIKRILLAKMWGSKSL